MKSIYKYPLKVLGSQTLIIHGGAQLLDVQVQNGEICLWAQVDIRRMYEDYEILIHGTGLQIPDDGNRYPYIATVQFNGLVWHVYGGMKA